MKHDTVKSENVKTAPVNTRAAEMEKILSQIKGVGDVKVMITYKSSPVSVLAKDTSESVRQSDGGKDTSRDEKSVLTGSGSAQKPYILKEEAPQVLGVVVVANGGGDSKIKREIKQAVKALCNIGENSVMVFEKK